MQQIEEKIDELNRDAWELRVSDSTRALRLSEEASELARGINYIKGMAEGLRTLGFSYIRLSRHIEALPHLEQSLRLFGSLNDQRGQSDVHEHFGIIYRSQGDYKASLESLFKSLELRQATNYQEGQSLSLYHLGVTYRYIGNLEQALEYFLQSLSIARTIGYWIPESYSLNNIGAIYLELEDYTNALEYFNQSLVTRKNMGDKWGEAGCLDNIGYSYLKNGDLEKADKYCQESFSISKNVGDKKGEANSLFHLAEINLSLGENDKSANYAKQALSIRQDIGDKKGQAEIFLYLAEIGTSAGKGEEKVKEQIDFLEKALLLGKEINALDLQYKIHHAYYRLYKQRQQPADALTQLEASNALEKEFHSHTLNQKIHNLGISYQVENSRKETEIYKLRNIELADLYEQVKQQKEEIQKTLTELKQAQAQLIQSEKMASLGELTAGIAHEIQNPLNFINNFSELNVELIEEMKTEWSLGNNQKAIVIADDIASNEEKIHHHGKRADAIVKNMLQHSRSSSGKKEFTDMNILADEYLRLAYHGLRAKDKSFNAKLETVFDPNLEKINIVPQEIGRVLLNLINNAFYAVTEKKKREGTGYEPCVLVSTKKLGDKAEIRIKDNGDGISPEIMSKIFQPFYTTKPTGQGTGLGLSMSYDIVRAHGGELKVETGEGKGAAFIILLPD